MADGQRFRWWDSSSHQHRLGLSTVTCASWDEPCHHVLPSDAGAMLHQARSGRVDLASVECTYTLPQPLGVTDLGDPYPPDASDHPRSPNACRWWIGSRPGRPARSRPVPVALSCGVFAAGSDRRYRPAGTERGADLAASDRRDSLRAGAAPRAVLPVVYLGSAAAWLSNPWIAVASVVLAAGHIPAAVVTARATGAGGNTHRT